MLPPPRWPTQPASSSSPSSRMAPPPRAREPAATGSASRPGDPATDASLGGMGAPRTSAAAAPGTTATDAPPTSKLEALKQAMAQKKRDAARAAASSGGGGGGGHAGGGSGRASSGGGGGRTSSSGGSSRTDRVPPLQNNYTPPSWSGPPQHDFHLEVLKSGTIIDDLPLRAAHATVGRHPAVDLPMENPSVSRQHAVFQFNREDGGCYLFDLGSTHGTFVNKERITRSKYYQIHVGDVIKFGSSSRLFIFQGPAELQPEEYTSDSLRQMRLKAKLRSSRVSNKVKRAIMGAGGGDDGGGASWGFDEDAVDDGNDEDDGDDEFDEYGNRAKKEEIKPEMLGEKDMKIYGKMQKNREKIKNLQQELGRIRSKEHDQGGEFTEGQQRTIERNEAHIAQLLESIGDQEDVLRERIGLRKTSRERAKRGSNSGGANDDGGGGGDDDDDDFYDRTGQKQARAAKRRLRQAAAGGGGGGGAAAGTKKKALSLAELQEKRAALEAEAAQAELELAKLETEARELAEQGTKAKARATAAAAAAAEGGGGGGETAAPAVDPLAAYMHETNCAANKAEQGRVQAKLAELKVEQIRTRQLINIVAPALNGLKQAAPGASQQDRDQREKDAAAAEQKARDEAVAPKTQKDKLLAHAVASGAKVPWLQKMAKEEQEKKDAKRQQQEQRAEAAAKARAMAKAKALVTAPRTAAPPPPSSATAAATTSSSPAPSSKAAPAKAAPAPAGLAQAAPPVAAGSGPAAGPAHAPARRAVLGPAMPPPGAAGAVVGPAPGPRGATAGGEVEEGTRGEEGGAGSGRRRRRRKRGGGGGGGGGGGLESTAKAARMMQPKTKQQQQQQRHHQSQEATALEGGEVAWTPPMGQDGSGKTSLNAKFGY